MKLNVPIIYQKEKSAECGLACVAMILAYYNIKIPLVDLKKEIKLYKAGTYAGQLGLYLLKNDFEVTIETMNPFIFVLKDKNLSQKQILSRLTELLKKSKNASHKSGLRYFIKFLNEGGKIEPKIPTKTDIEKEFKKKQPLIALLTSKFLSSDKPIFNFHYNVVTGLDNNNIYINDPLLDSSGGNRSYSIDEYLFGIYASTAGDIDNGSLIKISKK